MYAEASEESTVELDDVPTAAAARLVLEHVYNLHILLLYLQAYKCTL